MLSLLSIFLLESAGRLEARTPESAGGWGPHSNVCTVTGARSQARVCHVGTGQSLRLPELVHCLKDVTSWGCCKDETHHNVRGESLLVARQGRLAPRAGTSPSFNPHHPVI